MARFPELHRILENLWSSWTPSARNLLESISPELWAEHRGFVAPFLAAVPEERWDVLEADAAFQSELAAVEQELEDYLSDDSTWWLGQDGASLDAGIAYFSMEFGIHEGFPIYSGGLGVLAGDHLKSSSDLGIPLIAVGLFYRDGYFHQTIDASGRQGERYVRRSAESVGLKEIRDEAGVPVTVEVPFEGRSLTCRIHGVDVGRVPLLVLDTDHPNNSEADRALTDNLYGGDNRTRIAQEMILGIGGVRALRALGMSPACFHLNEGHCAFLLAERLREEMESGTEDPISAVSGGAVFTTHTPVPAGHDRFADDLVRRSFEGWSGTGLASVDSLLQMGRDPSASATELCMTVLGLKLTRATNGVSEKHGEVSRQMWSGVHGVQDGGSVPIGHITNGVHGTTWLGEELQDYLDSALPEWRRRMTGESRWDEVMDLPSAEVWAVHCEQKQRLIDFVRERQGVELDPNALLMGFARRFATYKRGDLILSEWERVLKILEDQERPLQIIYAGKAHPKDEGGKAILQRICEAAADPRVGDRLVVIEDYEMAVGRAMTQGVDLWLNNPRRPREASGTSGQKVAMNGGLNCSTLDGWWLEGYRREALAGWAVGEEQPDENLEAGDRADASALYQLLESEILPCFFTRDEAGLPQEWIRRMKASIATCLPAYNTDRMLADYVEQVYLARD